MNRVEKQNYIKQIAGTLHSGWFDGSNTILVWVIYGVIGGICLGGLAILLAFSSLDYINGDISMTIFVVYIVVEIIGCLCFPIGLLYILIKNERHKKKILVWLCDAVELDAYSHKIGEIQTLLSPTIYKIKVDFAFKDKHFSCESAGEHIGRGVPPGYQRVWKNYLDRKVKILYSPSHNEVMMLK